jgi:hypothetical protein
MSTSAVIDRRYSSKDTRDQEMSFPKTAGSYSDLLLHRRGRIAGRLNLE